jgi:hypothetical protein
MGYLPNRELRIYLCFCATAHGFGNQCINVVPSNKKRLAGGLQAERQELLGVHDHFTLWSELTPFQRFCAAAIHAALSPNSAVVIDVALLADKHNNQNPGHAAFPFFGVLLVIHVCITQDIGANLVLFSLNIDCKPDLWDK